MRLSDLDRWGVYGICFLAPFVVGTMLEASFAGPEENSAFVAPVASSPIRAVPRGEAVPMVAVGVVPPPGLYGLFEQQQGAQTAVGERLRPPAAGLAQDDLDEMAEIKARNADPYRVRDSVVAEGVVAEE